MSNAQAKILASTLELLEKEKCKLLSAVSNHVAKVFQAGQEWVKEKGGHQMTFSEIMAVVENSVELIMQKREGLITESDETCEPSASFQSQPLAAVSSSGETSVADVDTESVHKIMARMDSMEQTISALQMTTDRMTEKQDGVEKSCQDNAKKMSDLLNKNAEHRGENVKKLDNLMIEVSDMDSKLKSLETRCTRKPIGFSVMTSFTYYVRLTANTVYKGYRNILSNHGGHFDNNTGVFTAPVDGLYVAFVGISQSGGGGNVNVTVRHSQAGTGLGSGGSLVCEAWTNGGGRSMSCMGVVEVKAGGRLYVWVDRCGTHMHLSNFSCFLIN